MLTRKQIKIQETIKHLCHQYQPSSFEWIRNKLHFTGVLTLDHGVKLTLPRLISMKGNITLRDGAELTLPHLKHIEGCVNLDINSKLKAKKLTTIEHSLFLAEDSKLKARKLKTINRRLHLLDNVSKLNNLTYVGGWIDLEGKSSLTSKKLSHPKRNIKRKSTSKIKIKEETDETRKTVFH